MYVKERGVCVCVCIFVCVHTVDIIRRPKYLYVCAQERGVALLSPKDSKIPRVVIPLASCPPGIYHIHTTHTILTEEK